MKTVVVRLTPAIILSVILGGLFIIDASAADLGELTEGCDICHGKDGASTNPDIPIIGGSSEHYLMNSMIAYIHQDRPCVEFEYPEGPNKGKKTTMCEIADNIARDDAVEIARHYAAKPFVRAKQDFDAVLAEKGNLFHDEFCEKCHGKGGSFPTDDAGILAGQWMPYLQATINDYRNGDRRQAKKKMKKVFKELDDATANEIIHYYGSFK